MQAQPDWCRNQDRKEPHLEIRHAGTQASIKGPAEWFTGTVRIDPLFEVRPPARALGIWVTFEPCACTHWHSHPLGQNPIVTAGCRWIQRWGGPVEVIRPGDVVCIPPGEKRWHGATATTAMTHIAIHEHVEGKGAEWMEPVADHQYHRWPILLRTRLPPTPLGLRRPGREDR